MVNYNLGKIYKIVDNTNDNIYFGSTCEPTLSRRLAKHVSNFSGYKRGKDNFMTSFKILENGDYDIILIEDFPCDSKNQIFARERYWTDNINCVNKNRNQGIIAILGGLKEYKKINNKEYREKIKK